MTDDFDPYHEWLGIEPHERPVNHYRLLGITPFTTDEEVIRQAADERMNQIRKYQMGRRGAHTQPLLNALSGAKLCLLNPNTKSTYDAVLQAQLGMQQPINDISQLPHRTPGDNSPIASPPVAPPPVEPPAVPPPVEEPPLPELTMPEPPVAGPSVTGPPRVDASGQNSSNQLVKQRSSGLLPIGLLLAVMVLAVGAWIVYSLLQPPGQPVTRAKPPVEPSPAVDENNQDNDTLPATAPDTTPSDGEPSEQPSPSVMIQQEGEGNIQLRPSTAELSENLRLENIDSIDAITGWQSTEDRARWQFHVTQPGFFRLRIEYASAALQQSGSYRVVLSPGDFDKQRSIDGEQAGDKSDAFTLVIQRGGDHTIEIVPRMVTSDMQFTLHAIELTLIRGSN